jgi:hypothetical protein
MNKVIPTMSDLKDLDTGPLSYTLKPGVWQTGCCGKFIRVEAELTLSSCPECSKQISPVRTN